ncbi:MAG: 3D domain-containing protein [Gemmatimonas sp.]
MRRLGLKQLLFWLVMGTLALAYLDWKGEEMDRESPPPVPSIFSGYALPKRTDSLPKPFARLKSPFGTGPARAAAPPPTPRPARLRASPGETVPVTVTAYCLQGRTRAGTRVREGIVAADPRVFPLHSEIELIIGRDTLGRFRVEDTGLLIKGRKLDLWVSDCSEARAFGRKRGRATLAAKIRR